jgi:hypothetical protein
MQKRITEKQNTRIIHVTRIKMSLFWYDVVIHHFEVVFWKLLQSTTFKGRHYHNQKNKQCTWGWVRIKYKRKKFSLIVLFSYIRYSVMTSYEFSKIKLFSTFTWSWSVAELTLDWTRCILSISSLCFPFLKIYLIPMFGASCYFSIRW